MSTFKYDLKKKFQSSVFISSNKTFFIIFKKILLVIDSLDKKYFLLEVTENKISREGAGLWRDSKEEGKICWINGEKMWDNYESIIKIDDKLMEIPCNLLN